MSKHDYFLESKKVGQEEGTFTTPVQRANRLFIPSLPQGTGKRVIFLTEHPAPRFWEHPVKVDGSWTNFYVCTRNVHDDGCPICQRTNFPRYKAGVYTIVDRSERLDDDGKVYKNEKKLFVTQNMSLHRLLDVMEENDDRLFGLELTVQRPEEPEVTHPGYNCPVFLQDAPGVRWSESQLEYKFGPEILGEIDYGEHIDYESYEHLHDLVEHVKNSEASSD